MRRHVLIGIAATVLLLLLYTGIVTAAQGFDHALEQASALWLWIIVLAVGLGAQAGLYSFVRQAIRLRRPSTTASMTASGSVSAGSMVACCAHHVSDVLPVLGLSGVAGVLAGYQWIFLLAGILSNMVGIVIMLDVIQSHGLQGSRALKRWNMKRLKKVAIVFCALVFTTALVVALLL